MLDDTISENTNIRKFLCMVYSTLNRNDISINHMNGTPIIEAFDYNFFFNINNLEFNLANIKYYFNNSFHANYSIYIDELKILEYVPKYINGYTLVASMYIKGNELHNLILNQHIINNLESTIIFDDINEIDEKYSIIYGYNFNDLLLFSNFIKQIDRKVYNQINQHNYLENPIMPELALDIHLN